MLKTKRQTKWRDEMRAKMKIVRQVKDVKLREDAWAKWRRSYQSHLSGQHYAERLVLRCFQRWRERLCMFDRMEAAADEFLSITVSGNVERCWDHWKTAIEMRNAENTISHRVGLRMVANVLRIWRKRL
jgi:protein SFI1